MGVVSLSIIAEIQQANDLLQIVRKRALARAAVYDLDAVSQELFTRFRVGTPITMRKLIELFREWDGQYKTEQETLFAAGVLVGFKPITPYVDSAQMFHNYVLSKGVVIGKTSLRCRESCQMGTIEDAHYDTRGAIDAIVVRWRMGGTSKIKLAKAYNLEVLHDDKDLPVMVV